MDHIKLRIPPGSENGQQLRVRGRGLPKGKTGERGDFHATLTIHLPTKHTARGTRALGETPQRLEIQPAHQPACMNPRTTCRSTIPTSRRPTRSNRRRTHRRLLANHPALSGTRPDPAARPAFDDEAVHTLRRIDHLRSTCEANLSGLKLILDLLDEVERLQTELRAKR